VASCGRLIAFEGVDGAGKSTVIRHVADQLRAAGIPVFLPRTGKEHDSRPTRHIRRLTRDRRNLDLTALGELLLYCAREAQVLSELVRPALARGETALIDRSLLTPEVLGMARGVDRESCRSAARIASQGLEPDLTLVFDVHPRTSRLRKRIEKVRSHDQIPGSRKGLAGSALKDRVRDGYLAVARERGYPVFHVERVTPGQLCERVMRVVRGEPIEAVGQTEADRTPIWRVPADWSFERALDSLPTEVALFMSHGLICARPLRARAFEAHPALAAWAMDPEDPLRERAAELEPAYALRAWHRRPLSGADDLRVRLIERAPEAALGALKHLSCTASDALREQWAERCPDGVLRSLSGREDPAANALRDLCWKPGSEDARASSLSFCSSDAAWKRRQKLLDDDPVVGLGTLRGLDDARANALLDSYAERAPKPVLAALTGRGDAFAHALRERLWDTGREVIDSLRGVADAESFRLRERGVEAHPSTVAHSLLGLPDGAELRRLRARCVELGAGDVHLLRRVAGVDERPAWPEWARIRTSEELFTD
jgi:dTMP kinase